VLEELGLEDQVESLELSHELRDLRHVSFSKTEVKPIGIITLAWYGEDYPPPSVPLQGTFLVCAEDTITLSIGSSDIIKNAGHTGAQLQLRR
jgi:hypothetical protein